MASDGRSHGLDDLTDTGNVVSIDTARQRHSAEAPLSDAELRQIRHLLAMTARIENAVSKAEVLLHRCPTARRVMDDMERDGG